MRKGIEDAKNQSASIRRDLEVYEQNKKKEAEKPEDKTPPGEKPYVNPLNKLTEEDWKQAMQEGLERSAIQSEIIREDIEIFRQNKEKGKEKEKEKK
jgi:hypothetical protein